MKEIPNKLTKIPRPKSPAGHATFADLILDSLDCPPDGGFRPGVMRARMRVEKALSSTGQPLEGEATSPMIVLEDADFQTAKDSLAAATWRIRSADLLELFSFFGL